MDWGKNHEICCFWNLSCKCILFKSDKKVTKKWQFYIFLLFSWNLWHPGSVKSLSAIFVKHCFALHFGRFRSIIFIILMGFGDRCLLNNKVSPNFVILTRINFLHRFLLRKMIKNMKFDRIRHFRHMLAPIWLILNTLWPFLMTIFARRLDTQNINSSVLIDFEDRFRSWIHLSTLFTTFWTAIYQSISHDLFIKTQFWNIPQPTSILIRSQKISKNATFFHWFWTPILSVDA